MKTWQFIVLCGLLCVIIAGGVYQNQQRLQRRRRNDMPDGVGMEPAPSSTPALA